MFFIGIFFFLYIRDYLTLCKMLLLNDDKTPSTDHGTLLHTILIVRI